MKANNEPVPGRAVPALDFSAVYLTPMGRLCKVHAMDGRGHDSKIAKLSYVMGSFDAATEWRDGFCLAANNWRILTRVG